MAEIITSYRAKSGQGALDSVDFSTVAGKRFAFFTLRDPSRLEEMTRLLTASPLSQSLVVSTHANGKPVLVTQGDMPKFRIIEGLAARGEAMEQEVRHTSLDPWKIRSMFGFGGQSLQMVSAFLRPPKAGSLGKSRWQNLDVSIFVFAAANLAANTINLVYHQGEQVDDVHQQRYLKQRINRELAPHLTVGEAPLDIDDNRQALRQDGKREKTIDKAKSFLKKHSVEVGELGLRYLGALGLAFPATGWKKAWQTKSMPAAHSSQLRVYAGLSSIFGKTVALTSAIPDPYNPKPPTILDSVREKCSFLAGGFIEITSFSALAYDCFFRTKGKGTGIQLNGKQHRDFLGGIGATMFVMGYIARSWAKFGERNVNMEELYAHASDTLAATPPEKMPQLLANTAASLTEHFQDKPNLNFATIYTSLANDLTKFHDHGKSTKALVDPNGNKKMTAKVPVVVNAKEVPAPHVMAGGAMLEPVVARKSAAAR